MKVSSKDPKMSYKVNSRPILSLLIGLGFITLILLATMLAASGNQKFKPGNPGSNAPESTPQLQEDGSAVNGFLAVVKAVNSKNKQITLYDIQGQQPLVLNYSGGTDITDQYGQIIAMSQIEIGSMVDASYRKADNKLTKLRISDKAWEYAGVNNLSINSADKTMKIAAAKYHYTDDLLIINGQDLITTDDLAEQDVLTIRGYEETIWSITVTRGHGTVVLEDDKDFIGDSITIGYEAMQQITDGMEITVREGDYNLTVENGKFSATKSIRVNRNEVTYVSLSDLGPDALKHGRVTFDITPFGADLFIDGELTSYANPIELLYGDHEVKVALGGYTTYEGNLKVDSAGKTLQIDLPEASSKTQASVSETDSGQSVKDSGTDPAADTSSDSSGAVSQEEEVTDADHKIHVQSPIGASVYIDGEYMGTSPGSFKKMIGSHVITFIETGYDTMSYNIEVSDDGLDTYFTFPALVPETPQQGKSESAESSGNSDN